MTTKRRINGSSKSNLKYVGKKFKFNLNSKKLSYLQSTILMLTSICQFNFANR